MRSFLPLTLCVFALIMQSGNRACGATYAEHVVSGFSFPIFGAIPPGESDRMFVARVWAGEVRAVDLATRTVSPNPFLTITDLPDPLLGEEQGLIGLTFDPGFATNGHFYVDYTGPDNSINIVRYRVLGDPATSVVADPTSAHTIAKIPKSGYWHNGGWMGFGPNDGYLYVTLGDAGGTSPAGVGSAQDISDNLFGKVLRIDVHGDDFPADPLKNYAIPPSNPFVGKVGDDEIWSYGLRNPWQASFDRQTGDLWINDVGELSREEVNFQPANSPGGANYGWWRREGTIQAPHTYGGPPLPGDTEPIYDYSHTDPDPLFRGSVIAGSGLYRGPVAEWYGHYLFSDFGSKNIWKLDPDAVDPRASVTNILTSLTPDNPLVGPINRVAAFTEAADGNMYLMEYDNGTTGDVFRIASHSRDAIWNGNDPTAGLPGNGSNWGNALNWTRNGVVDSVFIPEDKVIFAAGSLFPGLSLGGDRTVAAVRFQHSLRLLNNTLRVLSGNVFVDANVVATIDSNLTAETANHSIRKLGPGTLLINGDASQIAVKEGTVGGSGTVNHLTVRNGGTVAPGTNIGILHVADSFNMHDGATLNIQLNGDNNSDPFNLQYDQLVVGGEFRAAGTLNVTLYDSGGGAFTPANGDYFVILLASGGFTGGFSDFNLPALSGGLVWEIDPSDGHALFLHATSALRSDYNGNGTVDAADYVIWRNLLGRTGAGLAADGTGPAGAPDGVVNEWDRHFWLANFGATNQGAGSNSQTEVPEPAAVLPWIAAAFALFIRRHGDRGFHRPG